MPKVGVVLSGCGVYDGSEIHEAVLTLLALDRGGAEVVCLALPGPQRDVVDHSTGTPGGAPRDVLGESARISRGAIENLAGVDPADLDALIFPGGFGAAKNLCDYATRGAECVVVPEVHTLVQALYAAGKPLGFACISPELAAASFRQAGVAGVRLTVGAAEGDAADALRAMGAEVVACPVDESVVDPRHRVASTPAYMLAERIVEVERGIMALVGAVLRMADG